MKLSTNKIITAIIAIIFLLLLFIASNTRGDRSENVSNHYSLEKMIQDYHYHLEQENYHKTQRELIGDNIQDKCSEIGVECSAGKEKIEYREITTGSLGYMDAICEHGQIHGNVSPLCDNPELYTKLEQISQERGVDFGLMLGIAYAESHIGANYKPAHCSYRNNWAGMKGYRKDGVTHYGKFPDNNCRIYHFKSYESFRGAFAQTLKDGYISKACTSPECISQYWVGGQGGVKHDWVARVRMFFENDTLLTYNK